MCNKSEETCTCEVDRSIEPHSCPYECDIHDNYDDNYCSCCEYCEQKCLDNR